MFGVSISVCYIDIGKGYLYDTSSNVTGYQIFFTIEVDYVEWFSSTKSL